VTVSYGDLNLTGSKQARDVWRQKDLGAMTGEIGAEIERHGVAFYRLK
jgi:hypothetical protein